tara:strand:+ start:462 stop:752 length:291 start_codon:yes stop_codon:yes gene_type:complete
MKKIKRTIYALLYILVRWKKPSCKIIEYRNDQEDCARYDYHVFHYFFNKGDLKQNFGRKGEQIISETLGSHCTFLEVKKRFFEQYPLHELEIFTHE